MERTSIESRLGRKNLQRIHYLSSKFKSNTSKLRNLKIFKTKNNLNIQKFWKAVDQ